MSNNENRCRFRIILMKITDLITSDELRKLKWCFLDDIGCTGIDDASVRGAIDFFQRLLHRNIINEDDLSRLTDTLDDIGCYRAAQILKDYQSGTTQISSTCTRARFDSTLIKILQADDQSDQYQMKNNSTTATVLNQKRFSIDTMDNITPGSTGFDFKTIKKAIKRFVFVSTVLLVYSCLLISITYVLIRGREQTVEIVKDKDESIVNQSNYCQPNLNQFYLIQSVSDQSFIDMNSFEREIFPWRDQYNRLCYQQWYFLPLSNETIYKIKSVHYPQVNIKAHIRFIEIPKTNSCQIQDIETKKIFDASTKQFINSNNENNSTLWRLIPVRKFINCHSIPSVADLTVIKFGKVYGSGDNYSIDDSRSVPLTIRDFISSVSITSSPWLNLMKFNYSSTNLMNKEESKSGTLLDFSQVNTDNKSTTIFNVTEKNPNERINRVTMYIDMRRVHSNLSRSYIFGIQFQTTYNRSSQIYGKKTGQTVPEEYPGFVLGYVRAGGQSYIERLQFVWYRA